jgi:hypothetical protein
MLRRSTLLLVTICALAFVANAKEVTEANVGQNVVIVFRAVGRGTTKVVYALTRGETRKAYASDTFVVKVT